MLLCLATPLWDVESALSVFKRITLKSHTFSRHLSILVDISIIGHLCRRLDFVVKLYVQQPPLLMSMLS